MQEDMWRERKRSAWIISNNHEGYTVFSHLPQRKTLQWILLTLAALLFSNAHAQQVQDGDFQTILESRSDTLNIWRFSSNPKVFVFDFPSLTQQGQSFNRITYLNERQAKGDPYPRVISNEELNKYLEAVRRSMADFAFGHDILVSELVRFYNIVERDKVELYPEEIFVREFLVGQGLIRMWRGFYQAMGPDVVIISIPQQQERKEGEPRISAGARYAIFLHEMSHAEYYTNQYYADWCAKFWNTSLKQNQKDAFIKFLTGNQYDVENNPTLLFNEMQAYLMFTPDAASFSAAKLGVSDAELTSMRKLFRDAKPPTKLPLR